ncbi:hypothetical protein GCT13_42980 [Paraburkholderia sp. CNPSo 3157]|uniref:DUF1876 domain-containing protein n=1 Tax=Paraburkholderia franconis TaxID=2654983 RepID=A0A7X1NKW8_9BURK|nr:hypothetical protein [Paraburkholderia franconis]MPW23341.1 hypothetical protein [Paraburkholderia franconis]
MEEQQMHRGFVITVSVRDDWDGGSAVTVLVERMSRSGGIDRKGGRIPEPEHYRSLVNGAAAVSDAIDLARRAIDAHLGGSPLGH